jgi:hypothetical protein
MSSSPLFHGAKITLLQAPLRSVTINYGSKCNSWYDIKDLNDPNATDDEKYSIK